MKKAACLYIVLTLKRNEDEERTGEARDVTNLECAHAGDLRDVYCSL